MSDAHNGGTRLPGDEGWSLDVNPDTYFEPYNWCHPLARMRERTGGAGVGAPSADSRAEDRSFPVSAPRRKPEKGLVLSHSFMHRDGSVTTWESVDGEPWKIVVWRDNPDVQ